MSHVDKNATNAKTTASILDKMESNVRNAIAEALSRHDYGRFEIKVRGFIRGGIIEGFEPVTEIAESYKAEMVRG